MRPRSRPRSCASACAEADAVVSMLNDQFDRATIDAAAQLKIIANVAVGYNNIDVDVRAHAGRHRSPTPRTC